MFQYENNNFLVINEKHTCVSRVYEWVKNQYKLLYVTETGHVEQFVNVHSDDNVYLITKSNTPTNCSKNGVNLWLFHDAVLTHLQELNPANVIQQSKLPGTFYTLSGPVTEYKIHTEEHDIIIHPYRKWNVPSANYVFNLHENTLGLSLRNANNILKLSRKEGRYSKPDYDAAVIEGGVDEIPNDYLPREEGGEVLMMDVGMPDNRRKLVAVASHEKTAVKGHFDFIKVRN